MSLHGLVTINDYDNLPEQPKGLGVDLKKHQLASLRECLRLEETDVLTIENGGKLNSKVGYLADDVGSGKSFVILGLIAMKPKLCGRNSYYRSTFSKGSYFSLNYEFRENLSEDENVINYDSNLLVVPHGLVKQWSNYIKTYTPSLKYYIMEGKNLKKIDQNKNDEVRSFFEELVKNEIIIVKDTILQDFYTLLHVVTSVILKKGISFSRIIIDEADSIKSKINTIDTYDSDMRVNGMGQVGYYMSNVIKSEFIWFVSSSIQNIRHSNAKFIGIISDSLYHSYSHPRLIDHFMVKNSSEVIKQSFNLPEIKYETILSRRINNVKKILSGLISQDVMDMINADSMSEAMDKIGESCEQSDEKNIVEAITNKFRVDIHNKKSELEFVKKKIYSSNLAKLEAIDRLEKSIAESEKKIALIQERIEGEKICNICFDTPENKIILNCCQHLFCVNCIVTWLNQNPTCAYCRSAVKKEDLYVIKSANEKKEGKSKPSAEDKLPTKMERLITLLQRPGNKKYLIFSSFDGSFQAIEKELTKLGKRFCLLKGSSQHINKVITDYKNGDLDIILLNSVSFGSGFNLENTTDIVMYHKMADDVEMQAIGRGQRFGRTEPLNVWKLRFEDE
jgi:SNF2 family DNA or RNA helicase